MNDGLEWWIGDDGLLECIELCNVLDNGKVELVLADIWVGLLDLVCLLLRADSGDDRVATGE